MIFSLVRLLVKHVPELTPPIGAMKKTATKESRPLGEDTRLFAVALELPVGVVEGTHWSGLDPARDAVKVEGVLHERVESCFFLSFLLAKTYGDEG